MGIGEASGVSVAVLGRVQAWRDGRALIVGPPLRQAVLAVLALNANRTVTRDEIIDAVWGEKSPASAVNGVQVHVAGLRRILEPHGTRSRTAEVLVSGARGYTLRLADGDLDVDVCAGHLRRGRSLSAAGDPVGAVAAFDAALGLWQGSALAGVPGTFADAHRKRLSELRLLASQERAEAMLAMGGHVDAVGDLTVLAADHPLREQMQVLLMTALHRSGRQAEALAVYTDTRRLLVEELGVEPSPGLQRLHRDILASDRVPTNDRVPTSDRGVDPGAGHSAARVAKPVPPRQLPAPLPHFAGRDLDLAALTELIEASPPAGAEMPLAEPSDGGSVVIAAIDGTAGVGKTTLAVRWAHQVADRFPDGQLYVNLRGFDPGGAPVTAAEALRGFLDAFAVPPERIPAGLSAQSALYRSLMSGRRVLVVLDNAATVDQIRPLLPSSPGCLTVVTSRNKLTSLVATDGAHPLTLDLLTPSEARQVLESRLGTGRVAAEPVAIDEIVALCARLPLALAITAARATHNPQFPLAALAAELHDERERLDALDAGEPATRARTVFSWSYQRLSSDAASLFRLLSLHPGPSIGILAAASLVGRSAREVRPLLAELNRAGVLSEHSPGRYGFHDLLRAYAGELAYATDSDTIRHAALHRVLDHYVHTGRAAAMLLRPAREPIILGTPQPGATVGEILDDDGALTWFAVEHPALLAAVDVAAHQGFERHTWQLAWTFVSYLDRDGQWDELIAVHETALTAAQRAGDRVGQAYVHRVLGMQYPLMDREGDADAHLLHALGLYQELDDRAGQANILSDLAVQYGRQGRFEAARNRAQQALDLYRMIGHRAGTGRALNQLGWYEARLGAFRTAEVYCRDAVAILSDTGDADMEAGAWDSLGYVHQHLFDYAEAITCYQRALGLRRALGSRYYQADTLVHLGDAYDAAGFTGAARDVWEQALATFEQLDHPSADDLRDRLARTT